MCTPAHNLFHLVGDVHHLFAPFGFENQVFRVALHFPDFSSAFACWDALLALNETGMS
jgi:hypothetical protein